MKLLSVIVPVYNTKSYLERCINSIRNQSYENLEILLIDDGSTDQSGSLCEKIALEDKRVRAFHKENGGSSSARNMGIAYAKGEYITFVDSDDYLEKDAYAYLMEAIQRTRVNIAQIGRIEETEEGEILPEVCKVPYQEIIYQADEFLRELLMYRGDSSFCTKILKKEVLEKKKFPEGELNEDLRLMVDLLEQGEPILSIPYEGYHVVYRMGSNTRKEEKENFSRAYMDSVHNADRISFLIKEKYPEMSLEAERFGAYQRLLYLLHIPISQMKKTNADYREIVRYLRKNRISISKNPYLAKKEKKYLQILSIAPKWIRIIHAKYRGIK
jgi:glycosyltransferase involved in cell wall biosynthesis